MKKGFTLAEVLITLAIVGVVASITLPNLTANIRKQQVGPALAKAINTIQLANKLALQENDARNLEQLCKNANKSDYFDEVLKPYIKFTKAPVAKPYYDYMGKTTKNLGTNTFTTNDGITFLRSRTTTPVANANVNNLDRHYSGQYYSVYVDINGNAKGPNSLAKDVFYLIVDTKGTVIPYGSGIYDDYIGNKNSSWTTNCKKKAIPTDPLSCAGSVADNGWKVIY